MVVVGNKGFSQNRCFFLLELHGAQLASFEMQKLESWWWWGDFSWLNVSKIRRKSFGESPEIRFLFPILFPTSPYISPGCGNENLILQLAIKRWMQCPVAPEIHQILIRNPGINENQLRLVVEIYHDLQGFNTIPGGCLEFHPLSYQVVVSNVFYFKPRT